MIKVFLCKEQDIFVGTQVTGHANFAEHGQDIVCAAVSVLTINTENTLNGILKLKEDQLKVIQEDNLIAVSINPEKLKEEQLKDTQLIFKSFELGIQNMVRQYPQFIELFYKEV